MFFFRTDQLTAEEFTLVYAVRRFFIIFQLLLFYCLNDSLNSKLGQARMLGGHSRLTPYLYGDLTVTGSAES